MKKTLKQVMLLLCLRFYKKKNDIINKAITLELITV